ncbi:hypothetical protein [Haladaptatus cibarius]|uniref:hypothetical protein n=1 Tax=Haladaptatus cibarius TaxID=453847 RepID=UPI000679B098|nr:hypothetical protein [Haladaptatus cibarius]
MATVSERFLWGRQEGRVRHWSVFVGGFAGVVSALLLGALLGSGSGGSFTFDVLLPASLFYAPPVISAISTFRGGGLLASLAVGVVPAISFGAVSVVRQLVAGGSPSDAPLWAVVVGFGLIGVVGSVVGFLAGRGISRFVER